MHPETDAVVAHNSSAWDREVESGNEWTVPVGPEVIRAARAGTGRSCSSATNRYTADWFPEPLAGTEILCLASGGGQQGPVLAAAGGLVTVLDNSASQLAQDEKVASRDNWS